MTKNSLIIAALAAVACLNPHCLGVVVPRAHDHHHDGRWTLEVDDAESTTSANASTANGLSTESKTQAHGSKSESES